jgi:hypothetical protein
MLQFGFFLSKLLRLVVPQLEALLSKTGKSRLVTKSRPSHGLRGPPLTYFAIKKCNSLLFRPISERSRDAEQISSVHGE